MLGGNNKISPEYSGKFQHEPYLIQQQPMQQVIDGTMYREQPQMNRNDWSQMMQQQLPQGKPRSSVWPEKLSKQSKAEEKTIQKNGPHKDSEYSEEYLDGADNQANSDDSTTTEAPKKVNCQYLRQCINFFDFNSRNFENIRKLNYKKRSRRTTKSHFMNN